MCRVVICPDCEVEVVFSDDEGANWFKSEKHYYCEDVRIEDYKE